jgi:hypothetical protein
VLRDEGKAGKKSGHEVFHGRKITIFPVIITQETGIISYS